MYHIHSEAAKQSEVPGKRLFLTFAVLDKVQEEQDRLEGESSTLKADMAELKKVHFFPTLYCKPSNIEISGGVLCWLTARLLSWLVHYALGEMDAPGRVDSAPHRVGSTCRKRIASKLQRW